MNEEPKSIWKKSWTGWGWLWVWLVLVAATFVILLIVVQFIPGKPKHFLDMVPGVVIDSAVIASVVVALFGFTRGLVYCCRHFKRIFFGLACFATLIALFYAEEDWRGWHAWNKFKHEWEAKGEKFNFKDFVPPPVPDDQNFAMAPIWVESIKATLGPRSSSQWKYPDDGRTNFTDRMPTPWRNNDWSDSQTNGDWAKGTITDLEPWQAYYRTPIEMKLSSRKSVTTNEFPITPQPQTPAEDVLLALSKFDPAIEELRQASRLPYSRFPLGYDSMPAAILLPHLATLKRCSLVLQLRAIAELQNNESQKALDDVKLSLRLANATRAEPFLISQLVRIAIVQISLQPVYEGLAEHKWSEAQLADLDSELARLNFLADYKSVMREYPAFDVATLEFFREPNKRNHFFRHPRFYFIAPLFFLIQDLSGYAGDKNPKMQRFPMLALSFGPSGWLDQNELNICQFYLKWYLPVVEENTETISPVRTRAAADALDQAVKHQTPENAFETLFVPGLGSASMKIAHAQNSANMARVAIALERYRLAHGEYPESLDALAPQFIAKVPHDVIGGQPSQGPGSASQPLHYRRTDDGQFVLYSVGWNEKDDGGVVVLEKGSTPSVDINQGDWVWRYPAK